MSAAETLKQVENRLYHRAFLHGSVKQTLNSNAAELRSLLRAEDLNSVRGFIEAAVARLEQAETLAERLAKESGYDS